MAARRRGFREEEAVTAPQIDRPLFIVGPHRSGTTLVYRVLSQHPDVGYLNRGNHRFPRWPRLAHLLTRAGWSDAPLEAQRVWDHLWSGADDAMGAADATPAVAAWYRGLVRRVLALRGAARFLAKYPRLSLRLEWLDAVFPGARFIHVVRDWRAVVCSTLARKLKRDKRGGGWFGVRIPGWREMGELTHELAAGRQFRIVTQELERQRGRFPGRFFRVHYEELCERPVEVVRALAADCELRWTPQFEASLPRDLRSANFKWRERLDPARIEETRAEDPAFYARYEESEPGT
jgi:hypothetical protein